MVIAVIMAGGKGSRMNPSLEKPLLNIKNRYMIEYILDSLRNSKKIEDIIVAISKNTPKTGEFLKKSGIKTIMTSGEDYVMDIGYIISKFNESDVLLTLTADIPLITAEIIDEIINRYESSSKQAMSVMVPIEFFREFGLKPTSVYNNLVPSGLNILRGIDKTQNEEVLIRSKIELALNINTCEDVNVLIKLMGDK